jgi:hypothetical protein
MTLEGTEAKEVREAVEYMKELRRDAQSYSPNSFSTVRPRLSADLRERDHLIVSLTVAAKTGTESVVTTEHLVKRYGSFPAVNGVPSR